MTDILEPARIAEFGLWLVVFLFSTTLHEGGHALLARLGGDDTAYLGGQVSLNPLPHIRREPLGMVLVPIVSFFGFGWMMGWASTPYDPYWAQRYPRRQALMSAAGPLANLLIAAAAFLALGFLMSAGILVPPDEGSLGAGTRLAQPAERFGSDSMLHPAASALSITLFLNLLLFVFNLLPIPPLDGSGIVRGLLPDSAGRLIDALRGNPMMGILGLLLAWEILRYVFMPILGIVVALLYLISSPGGA